MHAVRGKLIKKGLLGALCSATLLVAGSSPAIADVTGGAGVGVGGDLVDATPQACPGNPLPIGAFIPAGAYTLEIVQTGTYSGLAGNSVNPVSYVGNTLAVITNTAPFWISPAGTHPDMAPFNACVVPGPVPISATVDDINGGVGGTGDVDCSGTGLMTRVVEAVVIEFTGSCTIKGNVLGAGATAHGNTVAHAMEGVLTPCYAPPPFSEDNPNPACIVVDPGEYGAIYQGTYEVAGA